MLRKGRVTNSVTDPDPPDPHVPDSGPDPLVSGTAPDPDSALDPDLAPFILAGKIIREP